MGRKKKIVEETKDYNEEDYSCEKECFKIFSGTYIATFYQKDKSEIPSIHLIPDITKIKFPLDI